MLKSPVRRHIPCVIARSPSTNEGMTALHVAAQAGRTDLVRYLLEKGANPEIADSNGRKAIDLVGGSAPATQLHQRILRRDPAEVAAVLNSAAASAAEIRALLENAVSKK